MQGAQTNDTLTFKHACSLLDCKAIGKEGWAAAGRGRLGWPRDGRPRSQLGSKEVPHADRAVCGHGDNLPLVRAPLELLNGGGVAQALSEERELIEAGQAVDEDFVGLGAEGHKLAARADLQVEHLVGVGNLGDGLRLVAVPEEDRAASARRHQLELIVPALRHRHVEAVLRLPHAHSALLLQVVRADGAVRAARVDLALLLHVGEHAHDLLLLVYSTTRGSRLALSRSQWRCVVDLPLNWMSS